MQVKTLLKEMCIVIFFLYNLRFRRREISCVAGNLPRENIQPGIFAFEFHPTAATRSFQEQSGDVEGGVCEQLVSTVTAILANQLSTASVRLQGLEHLSLLEQLNLYYNKIQDLKEIFRLRKNPNLRDVDLRLNPVTANEPDYRLFIAHMLPLLRRLGERTVGN